MTQRAVTVLFVLALVLAVPIVAWWNARVDAAEARQKDFERRVAQHLGEQDFKGWMQVERPMMGLWALLGSLATLGFAVLAVAFVFGAWP
jgi:hypothetical protein